MDGDRTRISRNFGRTATVYLHAAWREGSGHIPHGTQLSLQAAREHDCWVLSIVGPLGRQLFSPDEARSLAAALVLVADECDRFHAEDGDGASC